MSLLSARHLAAACLTTLTALVALPAGAGTWGSTRTLEGPLAVASPPEAPHVAMNASGNALLAWNASGAVRYADHRASWQRSKVVPGGGTGAGPVAVAIGPGDVAAIAWTTVATRYVPSRLLVSLRPRGGSFGAAFDVAAGTGVWELHLGVDCSGTVTLLWSSGAALLASEHAGVAGTGACDGQPGPGPWSAPAQVSSGLAGAGLPDLVVNDAGAALAVWQESVAGTPTAILAAQRAPGGFWQAPVAVSAGGGHATWNPKPALDAAGNAAVAYLDGNSMVVATRPAGAGWGAPVVVSGNQNVYYPALAMSAQGDLLAAWQTLDAANTGSVWHSLALAGSGWTVPARLSATADSAGWPSVAFSADGSVAVVGWVDDASNTARASVRSAGVWKRSSLGGGWWGGSVPVAAGGAGAVAGWAVPNAGNPNSALIVARVWK